MPLAMHSDNSKRIKELEKEVATLKAKLLGTESACSNPMQLSGTIEQTESEWQTIVDSINYPISLIDEDCIIKKCNKAFASFVDTTKEKTCGEKCYKLVHQRITNYENCPFLRAKESCKREEMELTIDENTFNVIVDPILNSQGAFIGAAHILQDITAQKQAENLKFLAIEVLEVINQSINFDDTIKSILHTIKKRTNFDAIGIRLREGEDFPYLAQAGFSSEFILKENTILELGREGYVCRAANGKPKLECTCGLVISGQTDPTNPLFTPFGSVVVNNSLPLLNLPLSQDPRLNPRNRCIHEGYLSVALIPLRTNEQIVGLLQINDKRKDRFTPELIQYFEKISISIGIALMRKQAQDTLQSTESFRKRVFDSSRQAIVIMDAETMQYIDCNPAATELYQFPSREATLGKTPTNVSTPTQYDESPSDEKAWYYIKEAQAKGMVSFEWRHQRPSGEIWDAEVQLVSFKSEERNLLQFTLNDITIRKQAEEKHRESERTLSTLISNLPGLAYRCNNDRDWTMTFISAGCQDLTGYCPEDFIDNKTISYNDIIHKDFQDYIWQRWQDTFTGPDPTGPVEAEYPIVTASGEIRWVWERGRGIFSSTGELLFLEGFITDITQRKEIEQVLQQNEFLLKQQNEEYLVLNEELTQTNAELTAAKEKAEESDRLKSAFLANLSHEIRTPLNAIIGFTSLLKRENLTAEKRDSFVDITIKSGTHLLSIINDIIEISKIDAKIINPHITPVDINLLIKDLHSVFKVSIPPVKKIELRLNKSQSVANLTVETDEVKLRQILSNLLTNAIKFTDTGYIEFGYKVADEIEFYVKDTGIGIDEQHHALIFERFRQVENDANTIPAGSGLGLAICKAYVEMLGGTINVQSKVGEGSCFTFTIPT